MKFRPAFLPDPAGLYGLITFLFLVRFAGPKALVDGDTLWHIKIGQTIIETGKLVSTDGYSHTAAGKEWLAHEWLSEVVMAAFYNLGGLPVVTISFFLLVSLTFNYLYFTAQKESGAWSSFTAVSLAVAPMALTHLLARPHIFTWFLGAVTLHLLICNDKKLWILPLLIALWSNLHGGVLLGLLLQGGFIAGKLLNNWPGMQGHSWLAWLQNERRILIVMTTSIVAMGFNPFGYYPFSFNEAVSADIFSQTIGEWKPADFQSMWYVRAWFIWIFIMAAYHAGRTDWTWRLLVPALMWQAMIHVRHISIAAMFVVPWLAQTLHRVRVPLPFSIMKKADSSGEQLRLSCWTGPLLTFLVYLFLVGACIIAPPSWQNFAEDRFPLPDNFSQKAINFIAEETPGKKLFNEYSWGDYLIYALDPPPPIFIDGRADMYGETIFNDYVTVSMLREGTDAVLEQYDIDWVLFPKDHPLVRFLGNRPSWRTVFTDETTAILVLNKGQKTDD